VFIRPGGTCVAVSPPLTARVEHFEMIAQGIEYGLRRIAKTSAFRRRATGAIRRAA
jgi:adenosylmethionine-8-amino-7-oxononanoate aminotransferase